MPGPPPLPFPLDALSRGLGVLGRHATLLLAAGIFAGLLLPDLAHLLRPLLAPSVGLLLTVSLLALNWGLLHDHLRRPQKLALGVAWQLAVSPLLAFLLVLSLGLPADLEVALIVNAAAPPVTASVAIALLLGLDAAYAAALAVVATLLLPLTLVPVSLLLLGLDLQVDGLAFLGRFAVFILLPFCTALLLKRFLPASSLTQHRGAIDGINVLLLLVFAIAVMDGATTRLLATPGTFAVFLAAAFLFNICFQVLGALAFRLAGRATSLTLGLASGNRNMALMLVLSGGLLGPDFLLYVALAQIPIFLLPLLAERIYPRLP